MAEHAFEKILEEMAREEIHQEMTRQELRKPGSIWSDLLGLTASLSGRRMQTESEYVTEPPSTNPQDVERELGLVAGMTRTEIEIARRVFAKTNHPDSFGRRFPEEATIRMQIANRLCAEALRAPTVNAQARKGRRDARTGGL